MERWNPRYVAYARAHGNTPEYQSALDRERYPGGRMAGYLVWVSANWREWHADTGRGPLPLTAADHAEFDAWLLARAEVRS